MAGQKSKGSEKFAMILLWVAMLLVPRIGSVNHEKLYYGIVIFVFAPLTAYQIIRKDALEAKFFLKWRKKRENGPVKNMLMGALRGTIFIIAAAISGLYIVKGYPPGYIFSELALGQGLKVMFIAFIFGGISGVATWYESEKKYKKIYYQKTGKFT